MRLVAATALALAVAVAACSGTPAQSPAGTPAVTVEISASSSVFAPQSIDVPADAPYAISFTNNDPIPHNVAVSGGPAGSKGEIFSGPGQRTYLFPPLPAGTYTFVCEVHPEMTGTLHAI